MIAVSVSKELILLQFSSDITFIDHAVGILNVLLSYQGPKDPTNLLIVSRELLKNAVVHGNRNDPDKTVYCRLERVEENRYEIEVEDEGGGFDPGAVQAEPPDHSGGQAQHGYVLIRALASALRFNEEGNRIVACVDA